MLRTIVISLVFILSLFTHDALGSSRWVMHVEKDRMTGTEERYPVSNEFVGGIELETSVICSPDFLYSKDSPSYSLAVSVRIHNGDLATYLGFLGLLGAVSDARIDVGDGSVEEALLIQNNKYANQYEMEFPANDSDASKLKLELELQDGTKHIVYGGKILGSYVADCYKKQVAAQEAVDARLAAEAKAAHAAEHALSEDELKRRELLAQYIALIGQKIERNWIRPPSARDNLECVVSVTQMPGGQVVGVKVDRCNGDDSVIRSVEGAIYSASPLPMPSDPSLFSRKMQLVFRPGN